MSAGFVGLVTKPTKSEDPTREGSAPGLTGKEHQSDRCGPCATGSFEVRDTLRDRGACVGGKQGCGGCVSAR
jgi:hypothetical protein